MDFGFKKNQNKTIHWSGPNSVFLCGRGRGVRFRRGLDSDGGASFHKKLSFGFKEYPFTPWLAGRGADYSIVLC
jgi:hypothetical protein